VTAAARLTDRSVRRATASASGGSPSLSSPSIGVTVLIGGTTAVLAGLAALGPEVAIGQLRPYLAAAAVVQLGAAVGLLRRRPWAIPLAMVVIAAQAVVAASVALQLTLAIGLGGRLYAYAGSGTIDLPSAWVGVTLAIVVVALHFAAARSVATLDVALPGGQR
jgi:hypothetical protein